MTDGARGYEAEDGQNVLDLLGFTAASPAAPRAQVTAAVEFPGAAETVSTAVTPVATTTTGAAAATAASAPLTRRELRERERAALGTAAAGSVPVAAAPHAVAPAASASTGHSASSGPSKPGSKRRVTKGAARAARAASVRPAAARGSNGRSIGSRLLSLGAMVFAAALAVGMSVPANAFYTGGSSSASTADATLASISARGGQAVEVAIAADLAAPSRDQWEVLSWAQVLKQRYGTRNFGYTVGNGPIRWPFPYQVEISSGFGERVAPCRGCSSYHQGLDFNPGNGAAIFAIADGVVITHEEHTWGFGHHVVIQHKIDGMVVTSTYAHMQYGSSPLQVGDQVQVGDFVGLVGRTGMATGPHLHFEITVDGVKVDPFTFLKHYAS